MMTGFRARRGAEEFHRSVEETSTGSPADPRHADLLELVGALRSAPPAQPRPEFVSDLRERLMSEAATALTPAAARLALPSPARAPRRERRIAVAVGGFAVVSATASMAVAAQSALPGDTLYPLKRALENASTTIHVDQDERAASLLDHAAGRLAEVAALTRGTDGESSAAVSETLHTFTDQASAASDLVVASFEEDGRAGSVARLRAFTSDSMSQLRALEDVVPEGSRAALIEAVQVITRIDATAAALCPSCGPGVGELPTAATVPVEDLIDGLSQRIPAADPAPAPRAREGRRGGRDRTPSQPDPSVEVPELPVESGAGGPGSASAGETEAPAPRGGGPANPLETLTEGLTGGRDVRGPRSTGSLEDVLQDTVDGVGEVVDDLGRD